jgi:Na+/H+ antiporter NhaD/arsenite permease-like protein
MTGLIVLIFILGYTLIVAEEKVSIDKSASALLTGVLMWALVAMVSTNMEKTSEELMHHVGEIASILFFLMGAMTIVELIDSYDGFDLITDQIKTRNLTSLLWIVSIITFFLSAILDNLTTAIVMVTLIRKLVTDKKTRLVLVGLIVIAANAGGAWSPMGDVTTTMLWIGGQISALGIVKQLFIPSLASLLVPVLILSRTFKGTLPEIKTAKENNHTQKEKALIFYVGIIGLISVPIFKSITHLPPFMGMMLALGTVWTVAELQIKNKDEVHKNKFSVYRALERIDIPSVLFFLGILLAVTALQSVGILTGVANWLTNTLKNQTLIVTVIGLLSAVVDNVPLVAAAMGMYSLDQFPTDHSFWELLAYCAGTGGSVLIIGSAAGVAAMGIEKIDFFWYFKKISLLALVGYFVGIGVYLLQSMFF